MADDMSNNNFGSTLHHSHVIRDYNKIKNNEVLINQLDSIGLFFFNPSIAFFTKPRVWFGSTFCFQDLQKTVLRCVSSPCVRKNNLSVWGEAFCLKFTHLPEIQNDFGNDPTNVMPFLLPKHLCYLFFLKEATGCVGKKSVQLQIHVGVFESGDLHGFPTTMGIN